MQKKQKFYKKFFKVLKTLLDICILIRIAGLLNNKI